MEWSPSRRGTLASGADDSLVLVWDLINQTNATALNGGSQSQPQTPGVHMGQQQPPVPIPDNARGPMASWSCDYEVNNVSWAPKSGLTGSSGGAGSEWLGVTGGRGVWSVSL
jgi:DDB1- and CUL4-associated factor 7